MNFSGIIRRVDELGRIVIPAEIRRLINIKEGENLEFIINNNEILLRKKSVVENNNIFFDLIGDKLGEVIENGYYIITDREKVYKSNFNAIIGKVIPRELSNLVMVHEYTELTNTNLQFEDIILKDTFRIFPYHIESDIAGFIVLYNIESIDKYIKLIKFLTNYIHDKLSL